MSLSNRVSYVSMMIDTFINEFSPNQVKIHLHFCEHSIFNFVMRECYLGFSNTSHVDGLDRFRKSDVDKVKFDIRCFLIESL